MAKRHKKKRKPSRKARVGQPKPRRAAEPAASVPEPDAISPEGTQPEAEAAEPVRVKATFTPAAPTPVSGSEPAEFGPVRKDLRKLGLTIIGLIVIMAGLVVWNDQTNVVGELGEKLFSLWQ